MKNFTLALLCLIFGFSLKAENTPVEPSDGGCKLTFNLQESPAGRYRIIGTYGLQNYLLDTLIGKAGQPIIFQTDTLIPQGFYYFVYPDNKYIQMLIGEEQEITFSSRTQDLIMSMNVTGSLDNKLLYENLKFETVFQDELKPINEKLQTLKEADSGYQKVKAQQDELIEKRIAHIQSFKDNHPNTFFTKFKLAGQNPELTHPLDEHGILDTTLQLQNYRMSYWDDVDFRDARLVRTPVVGNKLKTFMKDLTAQNIDSVIKYSDYIIEKSKGSDEIFKFITNWIAIEYEKSSIMGGEKIFVHLVDKYFTDELAFWSNDVELGKIRKKVNEMRVSMLGMQGQNIICTNVKGEKEALFSLDSKIILLYMYSYSCDHCKKRTPHLKKVYDEWHEKGVDVYAFCVDSDVDRWKKFITEYGIEAFHNTIDPKYESRYAHKYHVDITPELYVLDADRKIISKDLHPNQLDPVLKRTLGNK